MNIAIILAVSEYQNTNCLPGCILDGQLIKSLLDETGKYNELLFIDQGTDSIKVKEKLSEFITNNQGKVFDEVFFYYTGHGDFYNNEFYYILSDFNKTSYRQTSLANSELDNFLRQLNPNLTIKIIDACHSGVTYIKDNDVFSKHLDDSKQRFNNCYFMFSSMSDQASYQTNIISHFTKSFIDSVLKYDSIDIRYKHIVDYISDDFEKNVFQKPLFISQASFTEIFCSVNQKIKTILLRQIDNLIDIKSETDDLKALSLVDIVKKDAKRYCSEEEALEVINSVKNFVENWQYSSELVDLYTISSKFESDYKSISQYSDSIGKWLKDNNNNYFSKITYRRELIKSVTTSVAQALASLSAFYGDENYKTVISGFELTVDVPFKLINIGAYPRYPNLDYSDCKIAFVFSQVSVRFFYFYSTFKLENWQNYSYDSSSKWQTIEVEIKSFDKVENTLSNILNKFDSFVLDPLRAKYILTIDSKTT
ncbi:MULTISPECIES: caspase family protein [unclassified Nodularia (in: cyanobacteria)]|uniref:caspase family protein n=1 Tax=unclassified Nodularia (in: cyanobacteria) TaxID=2656917 RepID=UPI00187DEE06|nr:MULTISPECIES: caspase family protein [unclassified Nodularia (in: cyanobacteria)]MBE9201798.1 caspase family protein [Nodularia sp. LEGE 06071]MCC2694430.1 caspase family protein [Nodularia sp. LEGE 04288]